MENEEKNSFSISSGMNIKSLLYLIIILVIIGAGAGSYVYYDLKKDVGENIVTEEGQVVIDESLIPDLDRAITITIPMGDDRKTKNTNDIEDLREQLKVDYNNLQSWLQLGLLYKAIGDYDGARDAWEFASVLKPDNSVSFHNLGDLYHLEYKDFESSEKNYLRALENNPKQTFTYQNLYELYRYSYTEKKDEIEDLLLDGISNNQDNGYLAVLLAGFYEESGNIDDAILYYEMALKSDPLNVQIRESIEKLKLEKR